MAGKTCRIMCCFAALLLHLTCVAASGKQVLDSLHDLQGIDFGGAVPLHSLLLLHWFANMVTVDDGGVMPLTFDPNTDYGFHHYGNYEQVLEPLPHGYRYYTVGNLRQVTASQLPDYVLSPRVGVEAENRDRIIIRVSGQTIDQVFITQHYDTVQQVGAAYDPARTYQVSSMLLRQIREFSLSDASSPTLDIRNRYRNNNCPSTIKNMWGNLACLGLFLYIVLGDKPCGLPRSGGRPQKGEENRSAAVATGWVSGSDDFIEEAAAAAPPTPATPQHIAPTSPLRKTTCRDWVFIGFMFMLFIVFLVISILSIREQNG